MKLLKRIRRIIAFLIGSFSAHCPACHKHFYGRNNYDVHKKIDGQHYRIICHRCVKRLV